MQPVLVEGNWVQLAMALHLPYQKQTTLKSVEREGGGGGEMKNIHTLREA